MGALTVVPRTARGRDRFYVLDEQGFDLGWVEASDGSVTSSLPELEPALRAAVASYLAAHAPGPAPATPDPRLLPPPAPDAVPVMGPEPQDWDDLAMRRPGEGVRAKALEEYAAMRERTRLGAWLAKALDVKTEERAWRVGADGEEAVGERLEKLRGDGWQVLHSVPVGKAESDIDHVLIGPGGVFTINTKRHPGKKIWVGGSTVMISGQRVPYIRNSTHEADRAERLLSAHLDFPVLVTPALVFATGTFEDAITIKKAPERVLVLDKAQIPRAFRKRSGILTPDQVDTVYAVARRSTTWTT